jgi:hypothetical protein
MSVPQAVLTMRTFGALCGYAAKHAVGMPDIGRRLSEAIPPSQHNARVTAPRMGCQTFS